MLEGGLPEGASVVLQGPPGQEKLLLALTFLAEGLKEGASGLLVLSSQSAESILSELRKLGVDLDAVAKASRLKIVDWYSWSEETVVDVEERGIILRSSMELANAGAALSRAIASLGGDKPKRAVVEILSPATNVFELSQVYAFAQSSKRKFDRFAFTSLFILEKEMHTPAALSTLHQPFDGVIEMERVRTGDRIVRKIGVLHLKDTTPETTFLPLVMTDKGFRVIDPNAPARPAGEGSAPTPRPVQPRRYPTRQPLAEGEAAASRTLRVHLIMDIARERLNQDPTDADAMFALAAAQATLGDIRTALESLRRLADLDERYPGLWVLKAKLHARVGEEEEWRQSRMKADQFSEPSAAPAAELVPCPVCQKSMAKEASLCPNCGSRTETELDIIDELEKLTQDFAIAPEPTEEEAAIPEALAELEAAIETTEEPVETPAEAALETSAIRAAKEASKRPDKAPAPKGLTNGNVLRRVRLRRSARSGGVQGRTNGLTNGLRGRTNGLTNGLGRTNGLTNGLGRTNGLTNGLGRTNGLTNGLRGRTNGLTNGLGRTNGLTNGLGRTNGLTNGLGRTNGLSGRSTRKFLGIPIHSPWQRVAIPAVVVALLLLPLFFLFGTAPPRYAIQIDGQFGDWPVQSLVNFPGAGAANPNIRITRFGAVDDVDYLAFYVEVAGTIFQGGGAPPGRMDSVRVFIDTDNASTTGYRIDGIGADRLLELSGQGGQILWSSLYEFDANRDVRDWNGWIKSTSIPGAASGSKAEVEAAWIDLRQGSTPVRAAVRTQAWDGETDAGWAALSPTTGTLLVEEQPTTPIVLAGPAVPLLSISTTALRQSVSFDSLQFQIVGTAPANAATALALADSSGSVLAQAAPTSRDVVFRFTPQQVDASSTRTYFVRGDFSGTPGGTYGLKVAAPEGVGVRDGIASLRTLPTSRSLGYLGAIPSGPRVDGAFEEWSAARTDALGEATTGSNLDIDLAQYGALHNGTSLHLYADVSGRILAGTGQPVEPRVASNGTSVADTDRDTVPDGVDPMPYDFNNDGVPDAQTNGDYDADSIIDYGFPSGTDDWLNTTLPASFPAPYRGLSVSVYIGPTYKPPLLGEDVLRIFLDIDNSSFSGYSIGGIGADRLAEIRGKDAQVSQSALLAFSGSFPGQWSWSPLSPVTVALGYHALELSVPGNATSVYVETGDFWGSVDSSTATSSQPAPSSFTVAAATTVLSVPWIQSGPQASATLIDGGSNSATTVYNHQRKVVRAGDVAGQTACDATNSDGCWYVVFYDQLPQDTYDSAPTTETVTTGSKVSGTFSTNVQSNNNAYINYREANTASQTVVSNNPTAVGTSPVCEWTNCANGETSNNVYADSSTNKQVVSFKTFGFSLPAGATISKVEFGIEAYQDASGDDQVDTMTLSWDAGTTYCTNTATLTPGTADPNAYTYTDLTTCTGHTWAQADFTGDNLAWKGGYNRVGGGSTPIHVDAVVVRVTYTPSTYVLEVQYDYSGVPAGDAQTLNIESYHSADENVVVQVLSPPSTWNNRITVTATSDPGTAQTYTLTSTEYNSGSPSMRFADANGGDVTQTDLWVDLATITTTMTKTPGTETITTGSKVSGTFSSGISAADSTYIQYREANTASTTVSSKNPTAIGTNPACAWTNCANGETSDNAYADSSTINQVISFKTFGFNVPSGSSITQVRFGIEAYQNNGGDDGMDTITLSWNAGTTYCSNTFSVTPGTSDPGAYTFFDQTSCTTHSWVATDFAGDNIAWKGQYAKVGGASTPVHVDAVIVEVTYTPPASYQAQIQYDWSGVGSGDVYTLNVKGYRQDEDINVQVLTSPSTWNTRITISATSNTLYTYALSAAEYNSGSPSIRFVDASGGEITQSDFWLDQAVITTTSYWDRIYVMRSSDTSGSTWGSQILLASGRVGGDPLLYAYDSAEPSVAIDSSGYLHVAWVSAGSTGNQQTLNRVRYTKSTVAYPTQSQLASAANWQSMTVLDDASLGYMPTISTDTSNNPHVAWSGSKTSGTVYYKNMYGGAWKPTVSWASTYTGISVDVSPQNNYVNLARYYEAATNEIQYTVCKTLATNNCDASSEFTKWDGTAGYDTVATAVESGAYPSLATTYEANGDLWIAYAKDVDGTTRAIYARFLDYPSIGFAAAETVDSLSGTRFTRPTVGVDMNGNVHALYVAIAGPQLYYKLRSGGAWGSRTAVDTSTDYPSLMVRAPNNATYGTASGAVYWKSSTSETYFYFIPEFEDAILPVAGVLLVGLAFGRRARARKKDVPRH